MEKFSKYNDSFSGKNPFIQPELNRITFLSILKTVLLFPFYILSRILTFFIKFVIIIKVEGQIPKNPQVIACNHVSYLDSRILQAVFNISNFYLIKDDVIVNLHTSKSIEKVKKPCIIFPEGANTNGSLLLRFGTFKSRIDAVASIKYSKEAVYQYGSLLKYLISLLGYPSFITIKVHNSNKIEDISKLSGLRITNLDFKDKENFLKDLENKYQNKKYL